MQKNSYILIVLFLLISCKDKIEDPYTWKTIKVTATAYNSTRAQTDGSPQLTAWGDSLKPGMPYIAVSRDLLRMGLKHNTPVKIEGLNGIYLVKDKMHYRWRKKIDIYMGKDIKAARAWGRKKLEIQYGVIDTTKIKK
ncbi:3D domain-containing protein [Aureibaculum conchae]|uniref:3D domain-containing protein n=1 Tax=Aureibaculum sp. 2308TA14-22 TaxID=3108392 RepID=UPI003398535E